MLGEFDISGGFALEAGIVGISGTEPDYISIVPGREIRAFGTHDEMLGKGHLSGGGDKIELEQALTGGGGLGARAPMEMEPPPQEEKVAVRGVTLAEINRADVYLQDDYNQLDAADDTYGVL